MINNLKRKQHNNSQDENLMTNGLGTGRFNSLPPVSPSYNSIITNLNEGIKLEAKMKALHIDKDKNKQQWRKQITSQLIGMEEQ